MCIVAEAMRSVGTGTPKVGCDEDKKVQEKHRRRQRNCKNQTDQSNRHHDSCDGKEKGQQLLQQSEAVPSSSVAAMVTRARWRAKELSRVEPCELRAFVNFVECMESAKWRHRV